MTIEPSLFVPAFGALLLLIGLLGGGFEVRELKIPHIETVPRVLSGILGALVLLFYVADLRGAIPTAGSSLALGSAATPLPASQSPTLPVASPSPTPAPLAAVRAYTVLVEFGSSWASGIALENGRILTIYHVSSGKTSGRVTYADGVKRDFVVKATDIKRDLALLEGGDPREPAAQLGEDQAVRRDDAVLAAGYGNRSGAQILAVKPGQALSTSHGQLAWDVWHIQTNLALDPGNAGGPLADASGRLIGVLTREVTGESGSGDAIAGSEVQSFLREAVAGTQTPCQQADLHLETLELSSQQVVRNQSILLGFGVRNGSRFEVPVQLHARLRKERASESSNEQLAFEVGVAGQSTSLRLHELKVDPTVDRGVYQIDAGIACATLPTSWSSTGAKLEVVDASQPGTSAQADARSPAQEFMRGLNRTQLDETWAGLDPEPQAANVGWKDFFKNVNQTVVSSVAPMKELPRDIVPITVTGAVEHWATGAASPTLVAIRAMLGLTPLPEPYTGWAIKSLNFDRLPHLVCTLATTACQMSSPA